MVDLPGGPGAGREAVVDRMGCYYLGYGEYGEQWERP